MLGLLGKKLGQTRVYNDEGVLVPVTVVLAGPNRVMQCKTVENDGYKAVQLGFEDQKESRLAKPLLGDIKRPNGAPVKGIKEVREFTKRWIHGAVRAMCLFANGDFIDAIGGRKGVLCAGGMQRLGFPGGDMPRGAKGGDRRNGAIGQRL